MARRRGSSARSNRQRRPEKLRYEITPNVCPERVNESSGEAAAAAPHRDGDIDQRPPPLQGEQRNHSISPGPAKGRLNEEQRSTPIRHPHGDFVTCQGAGQTVAPGIADHLKPRGGAMRQRVRIIDFWRGQQFPRMRRLEVLHINAVGPDHVPRTLQHERKRFCSREIAWLAIVKKRERKARNAIGTEENKAVAFLRGIRRLPRESRNLAGGGNVPTLPVDAKLPMMEGTLQRLSDDGPLTQVCAHVDTLCIQHGDMRTLRPEGDQLPP